MDAPKLSLLRTQKNKAFQALKNRGLEPSEFDWTEEFRERALMGGGDAAFVPALVHQPSGYRFVFDFRSEPIWVSYSPSKDLSGVHQNCVGWSSVEHHFREWTHYLKRELDAPDLWAAISSGKALPAAIAGMTENAPFSAEEKPQVIAAVVEIEQYFLASRDFSPEEKQFLKSEFGYVKEASGRLGRKDWLLMAVGVIVNTIISLALLDKANGLWQFACRAINNALQFPDAVTRLLS